METDIPTTSGSITGHCAFWKKTLSQSTTFILCHGFLKTDFENASLIFLEIVLSLQHPKFIGAKYRLKTSIGIIRCFDPTNRCSTYL